MGTLPAWPQRRPPRKGNFPPLSVMAWEGSGGSGTHTTGGKDSQHLPTPVTPPTTPPHPRQQVWAPGSTATCRLRFFSGNLCLPELPPHSQQEPPRSKCSLGQAPQHPHVTVMRSSAHSSRPGPGTETG